MSKHAPVGHGRRHVGVHLGMAYDAFIGLLFAELAERGFDDLRAAHTRVFQNLREEGLRLTEMARGAGMTPQSMGALVDDLERLGYVVREPDPKDRRASLIRPTDRAREEVVVARKVIADIEASLATELGESRFRDLVRDVSRVQELLSGELEVLRSTRGKDASR